MSGIKEKIENNVAIWMLATLLTGFLSGLATYEGALEIMDLEKISADRLTQLEMDAAGGQGGNPNTDIHAMPLPSYLNASAVELIFTKVKAAYNDEDVAELYQLMGPMGKAQVTEATAALQMKPVFESLGKMESGFFVQHHFMGKQGLYKFFALNFHVRYEKADNGFATVMVIDDGSAYQIKSMMFNRL